MDSCELPHIFIQLDILANLHISDTWYVIIYQLTHILLPPKCSINLLTVVTLVSRAVCFLLFSPLWSLYWLPDWWLSLSLAQHDVTGSTGKDGFNLQSNKWKHVRDSTESHDSHCDLHAGAYLLTNHKHNFYSIQDKTINCECSKNTYYLEVTAMRQIQGSNLHGFDMVLNCKLPRFTILEQTWAVYNYLDWT